MNQVYSGSGDFRCLVVRLHRGDDLMESIRKLCIEQNLGAGVILSAVGCISRGRIRDASGVNIREIEGHYEIVSLMGTVGKNRCHLHISLSRDNLNTIGGHLCPGCIVNTTCEVVIGELPGLCFDREPDPETGYNELAVSRI